MEYIPWTEERLKALTELWNRNIGSAFPMKVALMKQNSFDHKQVLKEASWVACNERKEAVGFVVGKYSVDKRAGWIQMLLVDERYRGRGIGEELLTRSEEALKERGAHSITLGKDRYHYFPGIPAYLEETKRWVEKRGYECDGREYDLKGEFEEEISMPGPAGVTLDILHDGEKQQLLHFLENHFPDRWKEEAEDYFSCGGTGREFIVMKKENAIVGFARINDEKSPVIFQNTYWSPLFAGNAGGIGPLGIAEEERGNGYGLPLVQAAMAVLSKRGSRTMIIDWTTLVSFYERLGFSVWRTYDTYRRKEKS